MVRWISRLAELVEDWHHWIQRDGWLLVFHAQTGFGEIIF